jgi:GcrA cell cycle regulator
MAWTEERVETLKKLWTEGHSASQIANELGGVSRNAVIGKVHRLGLSGRATPSRPVKRPPALARPRRRATTPGPASATEETAPAAPRGQKRRSEALAPLPLDDGETASILTLRETMCKWPIGDPADSNFAFCGRKATCGPYCAEHARIAFQPSRKQARTDVSSLDYVPKIAG